MADTIKTGIEKTELVAVGLQRCLIGKGYHCRPNRGRCRCTAKDLPACARTTTHATIHIVTRLWVGIDRYIGYFAKARRVGIGHTWTLLPGWHLPHLAHAAATGTVLYCTIIPHQLC